jgi:hypothetical protein
MSGAAAAAEERMCYTHDDAHRHTVSRCILVLNPALVNFKTR